MYCEKHRIPIIIDTDIGEDIDDTWALGLALLRDELDIKLITTAWGDNDDHIYAAKVIAKLNECFGQGSIDIGLGSNKGKRKYKYQEDWVQNYDLNSYKGKIYADGVAQMIDVINKSAVPVTILAIGPCTNLAEAVKRDPGIADKVNVIAVFGAIYTGYFGREVCPEYNVVTDIEAAKVFISEYKNILITPVDTCFEAVVDNERYKRIEECRAKSKGINAVLENFEVWGRLHPYWQGKNLDHSSELCDAVAVYLAITNYGIINKKINLKISDTGITEVSGDGVPIDTAIEWSDNAAFLDFIADTFCNSVK